MTQLPKPPAAPDGTTIDRAAQHIGVTGQRMRALLYAAYSAARIGDLPVWPWELAGTQTEVIAIIRYMNELAIHAAAVRNAARPSKIEMPTTRRSMRLSPRSHRR